MKAKITTFDTKLKELYSNTKAVTKTLRFEAKETSRDVKILRYIYSSTGSDKNTVELVYLYNVSVNNGQVTLEYTGPGDDNAVNMLNKLPEIKDVLQALNGTYNLSATDAANPTLGLQMTNKNDASKFLKLTGSLK